MTFLSMIILIIGTSVDTFLTSYSYSTSKIRISLRLAVFLNFAVSFILLLFTSLGTSFSMILSVNFTKITSFTLLLFLGIYYSFKYYLDILIKSNLLNVKSFKLSDYNILLYIYLDSTAADIDHSKDLNLKEIINLSIILSLDQISVGLSAGLLNYNPFLLSFLSFIIGLFSMLIGNKSGALINKKTNLNLGWLSGLIFIVLSIIKLIF